MKNSKINGENSLNEKPDLYNKKQMNWEQENQRLNKIRKQNVLKHQFFLWFWSCISLVTLILFPLMLISYDLVSNIVILILAENILLFLCIILVRNEYYFYSQSKIELESINSTYTYYYESQDNQEI